MAESAPHTVLAAADSPPRPALAGLALATFVALLGMVGPTAAPGRGAEIPEEASPSEGAEAEERAPAAEIDLIAALELAYSGPRPSEAEVSSLEANLSRDPDDLAARLRLLGYYLPSGPSEQESWERHLVWLVQQYPANEEAAILTRQLRPLPYEEAFELARRLWLEQVERYPFDPRVQANAARFFSLDDRELAEELLERAASLEPQNPDWSRQLDLLRELEARSSQGVSVDITAARKAVSSFAAALAGATRAERDVLLGDAARAAIVGGDFVRARTWAKEMLERAEEAREWNAGNLAHEGHLLLGRLDLRSGDLDAARRHLQAAGEVPQTPRLRGLGPGMKLAEELLVEGEVAAVVAYLDRCGDLWEAGAERLDTWKDEVARGQLPDFGVLLGR